MLRTGDYKNELWSWRKKVLVASLLTSPSVKLAKMFDLRGSLLPPGFPVSLHARVRATCIPCEFFSPKGQPNKAATSMT